MEQLNAKKDSWVAWSLLICLALALSLSMTACAKKKGSSASTPTDPSVISPSCTDCGTYTTELMAALNLSRNTAVDQMQMSLVVFAPASAATSASYNGGVFVKGYLKMQKQANYVGCTIPAGEYVIQSVQAGGTYSNQNTFELSSVQAQIVKTDDANVKFPLTIDYLSFNTVTQRNFTEGSATYGYQASFYGQTYICANNTGLFFPYEN
jgi:hypothetical protein